MDANLFKVGDHVMFKVSEYTHIPDGVYSGKIIKKYSKKLSGGENIYSIRVPSINMDVVVHEENITQ